MMDQPLPRDSSPALDPVALLNRHVTSTQRIDADLPEWARRGNPVVRRHLGVSWRSLPPNLRTLRRIFWFQLAILLISLPLPGIFAVLITFMPIGLVIIPTGLVMLANSLFHVAWASAAYWSNERRDGTLPLTLSIPQPLRHTIYAKIAAAIWRQAENLMLVSIGVMLISLPILIILYDTAFSLDANPIGVRVAIVISLLASVARLWLETIMVGAIAALCGAHSTARIPATTAALVGAGFYFLLVNMARLLPTYDLVSRVLVDAALPIGGSIAITALCLWLTERTVRRL